MSYSDTETIAGSTGECKALFDACTPQIYLQNSFRITGLQVDASTRAIKRRIDDLKHAEELGDADEEHEHAFALNPTPSIEQIREAAQKLQDPETRIIEEFFWFWPNKWGNGQDDSAHVAISIGDKKTAFDSWSEALSNEDTNIRIIAKHNLAVMFQLVALDGENARLSDNLTVYPDDKISRYWRRCFKYWEEIVEDEAFWSLVSERIRIYDDPRLTTGFVRRLRATLPGAMCKINGLLALSYAERGKLSIAETQITYMRQTFNDRNDVSKTISSITEPLKTRVRNAVEQATVLAREEPVNGGTCARELLQTVEKPIQILRVILPKDDHERIDVCDSVADACLACQIAFARETRAWGESIEILEAAAALAESEEVKGRIEENRSSVRIASLMDPILNVCNEVLEAAQKEPESADRQAHDLLAIAPEMFAKLDESLSPAEYLDRAKDHVAFAVMQCAIAFGNKTDKWLPAIPLFEASLELANDPELKERIEENLKTARRNEKFSDLEPISSAPGLSTINGIGCKLYGATDFDSETGSHLATYYFVALYIPIFPICRYRVISTSGGYRFLGKAPLRTFDKVHIFLSLALIAGFIIFNAVGNSANPNRTTSSSYSPSSSGRTATSPPQPSNATPSPVPQPTVKNPYDGTGRHGAKAALGEEIESGKRRAKLMESQIEEMDGKLKDYSQRLKRYEAAEMADEYNSLVPEFNSLVDRRHQIYQEYEQLIDDVNAKVNRYNTWR